MAEWFTRLTDNQFIHIWGLALNEIQFKNIKMSEISFPRL